MTGERQSVAMTGEPLRLTAGDGPWAWRTARYDCLDGAIDTLSTTFTVRQCQSRRHLGSILRTMGVNDSLAPGITFSFPGDTSQPPLAIKQLNPFEKGGVGTQVWGNHPGSNTGPVSRTP